MIAALIDDRPSQQRLLAVGLVTLSICAFLFIQYLFYISEVPSGLETQDMRLVRCINETSSHCVEVKPATSTIALLKQRSAHTYWKATSGLLFFIGTIVLCYSFWIIATPWKDNGKRLGKPMLGYLSLIIAFLFGLVLLRRLPIEFGDFLPPFLLHPGPLSEFIAFANPEAGSMARIPKAAEIAVVFLILAFATTVIRHPSMSELDYIKMASRRLKTLLGLTSVFFITGVMISNFAFSWLVSYVDPSTFKDGVSASKAMSDWVTAATFQVSIAYTLLILAAFVPPALYINRQAGLYALEQMPENSNDERYTMLDAEGIAINWRQGLTQLMAILAPLIAGPFVKALTDSVSAL